MTSVVGRSGSKDPTVRGGAVHEQAHRRRMRTELERRHAPCVLTVELERLAAGREDPQPRCAFQEQVDQRGSVLEEVLAVVQHQQGVALLQVRREPGLGGRGRRARLEIEGRRERLRHRPAVGDRADVHEPDAVGSAGSLPGRHLDRQPGLAASAFTGEGHEPVRGDELADLGERRLAPDE